MQFSINSENKNTVAPVVKLLVTIILSPSLSYDSNEDERAEPGNCVAKCCVLSRHNNICHFSMSFPFHFSSAIPSKSLPFSFFLEISGCQTFRHEPHLHPSFGFRQTVMSPYHFAEINITLCTLLHTTVYDQLTGNYYLIKIVIYILKNLN